MVKMEKDSRQIILDTALKHFVQKGFAATRTKEIAEETGFNKALLHYYFRTKDQLYQEVLQQTINKVLPRLAKAMSTDGPFMERVEYLVHSYIDILIENPELPLFVMSELSQQKESFIQAIQKQAGYFPAIFSFIQQMNEEMESGQLRSIPPMQLILNILGMSVFPFMAKPMINNIFGVADGDFITLMEERKTIIVDFVKYSLQGR
ncbi:MAG: TetR/AcrR family transcriptional regulator [Saprospiraceae bacterium]